MLKDFLIVGTGSFMGGGLRFLVSKICQQMLPGIFPWGTYTVNIVGCLLIGFFSVLSLPGHTLSPATRLLLTTGFCGGFTTFSTFMSETDNLFKGDNPTLAVIYLAGSVLVGMAAVIAGRWLGEMIG